MHTHLLYLSPFIQDFHLQADIFALVWTEISGDKLPSLGEHLGTDQVSWQQLRDTKGQTNKTDKTQSREAEHRMDDGIHLNCRLLRSNTYNVFSQ